MFGKTGNLRCVKVWFHAFSVKRNQDKGSLIPGNPGVPGGRRGSQCTPNSPCPHKKKLPSHRYLSRSPYSQHFIFSLLPTFYFLPPPYFFGLFLSPPYCVPPPSNSWISSSQIKELFAWTTLSWATPVCDAAWYSFLLEQWGAKIDPLKFFSREL